MNILYIADPNSIHDVRWINFFALEHKVKCYVIFRKCHMKGSDADQMFFDRNVVVVESIHDASTVRPWRNWTQARRIRNIIKKNDICILHILYAEPNALWSNWRYTFKVPVVITTRGTDILQTIPAFFNRSSILDRVIAASYRKAFLKANLITCTSEAQTENLSRLKIRHGNIMVIRTGVNFKLLDQVEKNISAVLGIEKSFVLMPRSMYPTYYHEFTLDAISLLDPLFREKYAFVFINSRNKTQKYFDGVLKKAETIEADIRFVAPLRQRQLLGLLTEASLVVMNPRSDGSPVTAMEAMACSAPLILPPLPYDFRVFQNVFRFSSWSPQSLSDKMREVLTMRKETLSEIKRRNFEAVQQHGNTAVELNKVLVAYNKLQGTV